MVDCRQSAAAAADAGLTIAVADVVVCSVLILHGVAWCCRAISCSRTVLDSRSTTRSPTVDDVYSAVDVFVVVVALTSLHSAAAVDAGEDNATTSAD